MSIYSTLRITRSTALKLMLAKMITGPSDALLERFMDELLEPRLYNCRIVPDGTEDNDDGEAHG